MLEIDKWLLVATVVIFLGLIAFLNKVLYRPLLCFMENRENNIVADEEAARKNSSDIGVYEAEVDSIIAQARAQAGKIRQSAYEEVKSENQKLLEESKKQFEDDFSKYMKELEAEKEELKNTLKMKLPDFRQSLQNALARI